MGVASVLQHVHNHGKAACDCVPHNPLPLMSDRALLRQCWPLPCSPCWPPGIYCAFVCWTYDSTKLQATVAAVALAVVGPLAVVEIVVPAQSLQRSSMWGVH
jgi:hypothetical protein